MKPILDRKIIQYGLHFISLFIGIIALFLAWQAFLISKETKDKIFAQLRPNILLVDSYGSGISGYLGYQDSHHYLCVESIRLQNVGGQPTSLTNYDVTVSHKEKSIKFANDRQTAYATTDLNLSPAISTFNAAFFPTEMDQMNMISTGDFSEAIAFPVEIEAYSAIDILMAIHYGMGNTIQFDPSMWYKNALSVSYSLHFSSGQTLEVPPHACQFLK